MSPKISIVIPTYNRSSYLKQTIGSALAQNYESFEIIISDNASQDDTAHVVEGFISDSRVKYFRNDTNIGMVGNWRKCIYEHASGDWFLILSDDDYFIDPTYLSKAAALIERDSEVVLVYANGYIRYEPEGNQIPLDLPFQGIVDGVKVFLSRGEIKPQDLMLCNVIFNRDESLRLEPFTNPYNVSCDSELFLKLCLRGNVGVINDYVTVYRMHGDNLILKVLEDFDLLINNWEYLISPYLYAHVNSSIDERNLHLFREKKIIPALEYLLLNAMVDHKDRYNEVTSYVKKKGHSFYEDLYRIGNYKFLIKLFIGKYFPFFYKYMKRS